MELLRYWSVVRRRWWLIALIAVIGCATVGFYTNKLARPQFEASTELLVNQKTPPVQAIGTDVGAISSNIMLIKTYKQIIKSPRIMDKVVQQYPELQASTNELIAKVNVGSVSETQVMYVSARDYSYERAVKIANAVSNVFQQEVPALMLPDNVIVLNWADPEEPRGPVSTSPARHVAVAFVLSVLIGVGLVFVLDQLDDTLRSERDIRAALSVPVLADIPKIKPRDTADRGLRAQTPEPARRESNVSLDA